MGLSLYTAPTVEPVGMEELKEHLRVTNDLQDTYIEGLGVAARRLIEQHLHRAIMTQTWDYWIDSYQIPRTDFLEVPLPPLVSVTHIKSYSTDGTEATFAATGYFADTAAEPGRICLNTDASWPSSVRSRKAVNVRFVAGWATDTAVPEPIRHGLKLFVARIFQMRLWDLGVTEYHIPQEVKLMLSPWRVHYL